MRSNLLAVPAALVLLGSALVSPASAGTLTVGPNLGFSVVSSSGGSGSSLVVIGWPSSANILSGGLQPGLRIGHLSDSESEETYLDTGVSYASSEGSSFYTVINTFNYQHDFSSSDPTSPFLTGGAGFVLLGGSGDSETHALLGLGVGVRHKVSEGHGAVRSEFRFDHMTGSSGGTGLNIFAVKFGFDLWVK